MSTSVPNTRPSWSDKGPYLLRLPWRYPGAQSKANGAPGNIQGNLTAPRPLCVLAADACWHNEGHFLPRQTRLCHSIALEDLRTKPLNAWLLLTQVILCVSWQQMPAERKAFVCRHKGLGHSRWAFVFRAGVGVMHAWWLVRKAFSVVLWVITTS